MLGKETIDMFNTSKTFGNQQSHGQNYQKLGKELMSVDDVEVSPLLISKPAVSMLIEETAGSVAIHS